MQIRPTALPAVLLITPPRFGDARGWFSETWNAARLAEAGIAITFVQDNHSRSSAMGTLRGLHYQRPPRAQDKLIRCTQGAILDVAVDIRRGSPSYGQWVAEELSAENGRQLLVPKGFLHGFLTLTPEAEVQYKCSDLYAPDCDGAVLWSSVGIDWPLERALEGAPILSGKDEAAPAFADFESPFAYEGPLPWEAAQ